MGPLCVGDLIYQGEIYDRMNSFCDDLPFYTKWCEMAAGPVLELCCGTGRLTIPLARSGIDITGLDITQTMLDMARKKAAEERIAVDFRSGDMRSFDLDRKFNLVFIPFNSLQHTYTIEDLERVFSRVRAHLVQGGTFIFDVFNPSIHLMVDREREALDVTGFTLDDGREVTVREKCRYDAATQINRVKWFFSVGGTESVEDLNMRCFYPLEMDAMLRYNGLEIHHKFGSFDEAPFEAASTKQIYVCRAKDSVGSQG